MAARTKAVRNAADTYKRLQQAHPDADCELEPREPFRLLVAIILSAQTTDIAVNKLLPSLFARYPDAAALAQAEPEQVQELLKSIGMFRQKARNIIAMAKQLMERHGGQVPTDMDKLVELAGVGRKTANVLLGTAFGIASGIAVDTHVQRVAQRLGWTQNKEPDKIEQDLMGLFPKDAWPMVTHVLIFHGRRICTARNPNCPGCPVSDVCPSAFQAEQVGRKPARVRPPRASSATSRSSRG